MPKLDQESIKTLASALRKAEEQNMGVASTPAKAADDFILRPNTSPHPQDPVGSSMSIPLPSPVNDACVICGKDSDCGCLNGMVNKGEAFDHLTHQLAGKGIKDPKALASVIGRKKEGKEAFQAKAAAGHAKKSEDLGKKMKKSSSPLMKRKVKKDMGMSPMGGSEGNMYMSEKEADSGAEYPIGTRSVQLKVGDKVGDSKVLHVESHPHGTYRVEDHGDNVHGVHFSPKRKTSKAQYIATAKGPSLDDAKQRIKTHMEQNAKKGEDLIDIVHESDPKKRIVEMGHMHEGVLPTDKASKKMPDDNNEGSVEKNKFADQFEKAEWKPGHKNSESHSENTHEMHVEEHPNKKWKHSYLNKWGHKHNKEDHETKEEAKKAAERAKAEFIKHRLTTKSELNWNKVAPNTHRAETPKSKYEVKKGEEGTDLICNEKKMGKFSTPEVAMEKANEIHKAEMATPMAKPPPAPKMTMKAPGSKAGVGPAMGAMGKSEKSKSPLMKHKMAKGMSPMMQHGVMAGSKAAGATPSAPEPKVKLPSPADNAKRAEDLASFMPGKK